MINLIIETISLSKLDTEIARYRAKNDNYPKYIICNHYTLHLLKYEACNFLKCDFASNIIYSYKGINIAVCDNLENGEVDII